MTSENFMNPSIKTNVLELCHVQGNVLGAVQILREIDVWPTLASRSLWSQWEGWTQVCENNKKREIEMQVWHSCPKVVTQLYTGPE